MEERDINNKEINANNHEIPSVHARNNVKILNESIRTQHVGERDGIQKKKNKTRSNVATLIVGTCRIVKDKSKGVTCGNKMNNLEKLIKDKVV